MGEVLPLPDLPENFPRFERPPGLPLTCSDAQLCETVKSYLAGAEPAVLAKMLGVPGKSIRYWLDSREWGSLVAMLLPEVRGVMSGQLTRVASLALVQLEARLRDGDQVFNQQGEYVGRREIRGRDLATIATAVLEQQVKLERIIGGITDDKNVISLDKLAAGLKRYAEAKDITGEAVRDSA
jgi:hypothetical protein